MKKNILSTLVIAGLLISGFGLTSAGTPDLKDKPAGNTNMTIVAKSANYKVDAAVSTLTWNAKKVTGEHNGGLKISKGELQVVKNKVTGGTIEMDMTTISDVDNSARLVNHLKSDDFFSAEKFPTATFKIASLTPIKGAKAGESNYNVKGDLTIKGITKPITFKAFIDVKNNTVTAVSETITVNRLEYDIKYRSLSFFSTIGDKAIEDTFTVKFNVLAKSDSVAKI